VDIFGTQMPVSTQQPTLEFYEAYTDNNVRIELSFKRVQQNEH
jgi:AP-1 complex subunit gamma-1